MKIFSENYLLYRKKYYEENKAKTLFHDPYAAVEDLSKAAEKIKSILKILSDGKEIFQNFDKSISIPRSHSQEFLIKKPSNISTLPVISKTGCPICRKLLTFTFDYFSGFQYWIATKEAERNSFAMELGFCSYHSWFLLSLSSTAGASTGFSKLAEYTSDMLKIILSREDQEQEFKKIIKKGKNCSVCGLVSKVETEYVKSFGENLSDNREFTKYINSNGLCLRHLGLLVGNIKDKDLIKQVISHTADRFQEFSEDMKSYSMKREALRRSLINKNEESACREAVTHLSGERGLFISDPEDNGI